MKNLFIGIFIGIVVGAIGCFYVSFLIESKNSKDYVKYTFSNKSNEPIQNFNLTYSGGKIEIDKIQNGEIVNFKFKAGSNNKYRTIFTIVDGLVVPSKEKSIEGGQTVDDYFFGENKPAN